MKYFSVLLLLLFFNCKKLGNTNNPTTIFDAGDEKLSAEAPPLPPGALTADFMGSSDPFYAYVEKIDSLKQTTRIAFEGTRLPTITLPESLGADLQLLKLKNYKNDVLLVNAKLKDTNFNEYYVFVWKDSVWKQPVNRFAIHKSNMMDTLIPIQNDARDSTKLLRYYSVFDMDKTNGKKYTWRLMHESIPIED